MSNWQLEKYVEVRDIERNKNKKMVGSKNPKNALEKKSMNKQIIQVIFIEYCSK